MKSKLITILVCTSISVAVLFAAGCKDNTAELGKQVGNLQQHTEDLQQQVTDLTDYIDKIEGHINDISIDAEALEFAKLGAIADVQACADKADDENFYTESNWQRIETIENQAVESINNADNYATIKLAVENAVAEIGEVPTTTATAIGYSLQEAVDGKLLDIDNLRKIAAVNNYFDLYGAAGLKSKYVQAIKATYGKAENLEEDEIHLDYFGEYDIWGQDGSCFACVVYPVGMGSSDGHTSGHTVVVGGVEFFFPGCDVTIWVMQLAE